MNSFTFGFFAPAKSGLVALLAASVILAQPVQAAIERDLTKLERAFWVCDYLATIHGVGKVDTVTCAAVTDDLKRIKFDGDFEKMLDWWRANKTAQHAALDRADMALAASASADTGEDPDSI